jgi:uncharacterized membrane protein
MESMTGREKYLYHQVYPPKLLVDFMAALLSLVALWQHRLVLGLVIMLLPPAIASFLTMRFVDLDPYKHSALGRYVARYMTHSMEAVRLAGMLIAAIGAWYRSPLVILLGAMVVLAAWLKGKLRPRTS